MRLTRRHSTAAAPRAIRIIRRWAKPCRRRSRDTQASLRANGSRERAADDGHNKRKAGLLRFARNDEKEKRPGLLPAFLFLSPGMPANAGIQQSPPSAIESRSRGVLDRPPSRTMTAEWYHFASARFGGLAG